MADDQGDSKTVHEVDVAIIGGGPGGLSAAIAIRKACPELSVRVFERARALRPSGGSIGLFSKNIFACFEEMGPEVLASVRAAGIERRKFTAADMSGKELVSFNAAGHLIIAWNELQRALLSNLPPGSLVLGCEAQEVTEEEGGGAVVRMANGVSVRARVVVGADGNRSACRTYVQGNTEAAYVGAAVWRFFLPGENPFVEVSDTLTMTGEGRVLVMQPIKREGVGILTYVSGLTGFDESRLGELNQTRYIQDASEDTQGLDAKLQRFQHEFKSFSAPIVDHIVKNAVPDSVLEHPMSALDPEQPWRRGCVVLLGDAAHVMPPNLGQGTPSAVEDAVQLGASLRAFGATEAALADYEQIRKPRVVPIAKHSTSQAVGYYMEKREECNPMAPPSDGSKTMSAFVADYTPPSLSAPA